LFSFGFIETEHAWSQNKKQQKSNQTGVGSICLNHFICDWMESKAK
jgi:hypothetical protein